MKKIINLLICFLLVITLSGCKTNYQETDASYFKFRSAFSDYIEIYEFDKENFKEEQLIIPSQYNGKKVINIKKEVFNDLKTIKIVKLPDYLMELEYNFNNCDNLETIILNKKIKKIYYSFNECTSLKDLNLSSSLRKLKKIYSSFKDCTNLKTINFSKFSKLEELDAFYNCTLIEEVKLPNSIKRLSGFYWCSSLKTIKLPNNAEYIGGFSGCDSLFEIKFPNRVKEIYGFDYCDNLMTVKFEYGCKIETLSGFNDCEKLTEFTIPSNTKRLYYFMSDSAIKSITIPKSVEKIDAGCFLFCDDLETVIIEDGSNLKIVNEYCFLNCPKLNEIKFPEGIIIEPKPHW